MSESTDSRPAISGEKQVIMFTSNNPQSRTWHDRLLGAAAGAVLTLATLWLIIVSAATATVIQRA